MEFELPFQGTPSQFAAVVKIFSHRLKISQDKENDPGFMITTSPVQPDTSLVYIKFWGLNRTKPYGNPNGWISAQSIPNGRSLLIISTEDDVWKDLEPSWLLLHQELERQVWIENNQLEEPTINKEREPKYAPRRTADYNNWVIVWAKYRKWSNTGMKPKDLQEELVRLQKRHLYKGKIYSTETLSKIIKAGNAGELETKK